MSCFCNMNILLFCSVTSGFYLSVFLRIGIWTCRDFDLSEVWTVGILTCPIFIVGILFVGILIVEVLLPGFWLSGFWASPVIRLQMFDSTEHQVICQRKLNNCHRHWPVYQTLFSRKCLTISKNFVTFSKLKGCI